jgi:malate/lactate dehydrogenase
VNGPRICVVGGAGGVGASSAAALLALGLPTQLHLMDVAEDLLAVQGMDLTLMAQAAGETRVSTGRDVAAAAESDLVVMAASMPHRDGAARIYLARDNLAVLRSLLDALPPGWGGTLMIASNPVDVLATAAHRALGESATVLGYVRNDTLRLEQAIADLLGLAAHKVEAWALGEHGPGMVALFDRVRVDGRRVDLSPDQRVRVLAQALKWYDEWQSFGTGRTSMWTTGHGIADLIARYHAAHPSVQPVCVPVDGFAGITELVCLACPVRLGAGRAVPLAWDLSEHERTALRACARTVLSILDHESAT